jgi:YVTN family beta-propeller protein
MTPSSGDRGKRRATLRYPAGHNPYELVFVPRGLEPRWLRRHAGRLAAVVVLAILAAAFGTLLAFTNAGPGADEARAPAGEAIAKRVVRRAAEIRRTPGTPVTPSPRAAGSALVYVPESATRTVAVINARTYRVTGRFRVGREPQHVAASPNGGRVYAGAAAADLLTVVDPRRVRPARRLRLLDPYNLYFTPDGETAIVVAHRKQQLRLFSADRWTRLGVVSVPGRGASHLAFTVDGRFAVVTAEASGHLVKVDLERKQVTATLRLRGSPVDIKLAPDRSVFYVADQGRGGVAVVGARRFRALQFIRTGAGAHGLAVDPRERRLYVANRRAGTIAVVDLATDRRVTTWSVGGSPDALQLSSDGRELWVSNRFHATVSVVATDNGRVLHTIHLNGGPHGLLYVPRPLPAG